MNRDGRRPDAEVEERNRTKTADDVLFEIETCVAPLSPIDDESRGATFYSQYGGVDVKLQITQYAQATPEPYLRGRVEVNVLPDDGDRQYQPFTRVYSIYQFENGNMKMNRCDLSDDEDKTIFEVGPNEAQGLQVLLQDAYIDPESPEADSWMDFQEEVVEQMQWDLEVLQNQSPINKVGKFLGSLMVKLFSSHVEIE